MARGYTRTKVRIIFRKKWKKWKKYFSRNFHRFLNQICKKSIHLNNFQIQWLVEQDVSSQARRVIRCLGKSSRRGLATFLDLLRWNVNFWLSSIRSIFDFILFPERTFWGGSYELGLEILYRLFEGWNCEQLIAKFFEKNWKSDKNCVFRNFHEI